MRFIKFNNENILPMRGNENSWNSYTVCKSYTLKNMKLNSVKTVQYIDIETQVAEKKPLIQCLL